MHSNGAIDMIQICWHDRAVWRLAACTPSCSLSTVRSLYMTGQHDDVGAGRMLWLWVSQLRVHRKPMHPPKVWDTSCLLRHPRDATTLEGRSRSKVIVKHRL